VLCRCNGIRHVWTPSRTNMYTLCAILARTKSNNKGAAGHIGHMQ
jgi:hypothetical protein